MRAFLSSRFAELGLVFGILFGVVCIDYSNCLHNAFMHDDFSVFSDTKLNNIRFLPNAFFYPSLQPDKSERFIGSDMYYRPVDRVLCLLTYLAFGNNPFGYHVLNLFLFAAMSWMVYVFIDLFFARKSLALVTSVLFAFHPINLFIVNYCTSCPQSIRFICMFLSLILFLKVGDGAYKNLFYFLSLFLFVLAILCHESSMGFPFYIVFAGFYFQRLSWKAAVIKSWPYWFILFLYLLFRLICISVPSNYLHFEAPPLVFLATFTRLIFLYITKLFVPEHIVFLWNSPLTRGANTYIWAFGLVILLAGWWRLLCAHQRSMAFFCTTWILLGFIPVIWAAHANVIEKQYGLIIEPQWVTFASIGFYLFLAFIGLKLYARWKKGILVLFIFLLGLWVAMVRHDNEVWGDEYQYYFNWSQQIDPVPAINYPFLADFYAKKNEYNQARYYFSKALEHKPDPTIYYNLGLIDAKQGLINQAKKEFLLSVHMDPGYSSAYNNLGAIYFNEGNYQLAKEDFLRTIQLDKYCIEARSNLGLISLLQKDYQAAIHYYQQNLDIVPYDEASLLGLAQAYACLKDFDHMDQYAHILMSHGRDPDILNALKKFLAAYPRESR